jgi:hypothetical protein
MWGRVHCHAAVSNHTATFVFPIKPPLKFCSNALKSAELTVSPWDRCLHWPVPGCQDSGQGPDLGLLAHNIWV